MSQVLTQYHVLYESMKSRRRRPVVYQGVDRLASRIGVAIAHRRTALSHLRRQTGMVLAAAPEMRNHSEAALDVEIERLREIFVRGRQDQAVVNRAFAVLREVARRGTGEEAFPVQIMGALALYHGRIIEMLTGEGKTLTGCLAAPLIAWQRRHLHIFTVNDYLAARDARSRSPVYRRCGVTVGAITQETDQQERFELYSRGIIYGTPKQITADWLRDQIRMGRVDTPWAGRQSLLTGGVAGSGPMIPGLRAALVDEADAVLIDEGVVPLIIARSRREDDMANVYRQAALLAGKLDEGPDYEMDVVRKRAAIKRRGEQRLLGMFEELARTQSPVWKATRRAEELVRQALVAHHCYRHGQQYQIVEGKVVIVDEYTGRFLPDRSWEHGLHQAVEAKENLDITADRETLARMSFQKFFRSYPFMCGMTGTAADALGEIEGVYARPVTVIPTNRPVIREAWPKRFFVTQREKWEGIADSIATVNRAGRPILVGTRSIAASELLSRLLTDRGLPHQVLNANFDKEEAEVVSRAGRGALPVDPASRFPTEAAITVATNMAGRGTDILLDLNARKNGGLHVILTEMHGAKRIDRQFIGRAGRQGDPGSSQLFVSFEDDILLRNVRGVARLLKARIGRREVASTPLLRGLFRLAQRRSEARDRRHRESVLRQDDWIERNLPGIG